MRRILNRGFFWVHASSASRFQDGYKEIAARMQIPGGNDPGADISLIVRRWLSDPSNGTWLMVVDNADDEGLLLDPIEPANYTEDRQGLKKYPPNSDNGSILLTSRSRRVALDIVDYPEDVLDVGPMELNEALSLVQTKLRMPATTDEAARELVHQLDCMPLAISQAAAYIREPTPLVTIKDYVHKLRDDPDEQLRLLCLAERDSRRDGGATNAILLTWHISFRHIQQSHPYAGTLLGLMSIFNREQIPQAILKASYAAMSLREAYKLEDGIALLRSFDLIGLANDEVSFRMHRLVQLSSRHWLRNRKLLERTTHAVIQNLDSSFPRVSPTELGFHCGLWPLCRRLLPHVEETFGLVGQVELAAGWKIDHLFHKIALFYAILGRYDKAVKVAWKVWQACIEVKGEHHRHTLASATSLGRFLHSADRNVEACHILNEICCWATNTSRQNERWYWTAAAALGEVLTMTGKTGEAIKLLDHVLHIAEQFASKQDETVLEIMESLARVYAEQCNYDQAILQYQQVVDFYTANHGARHASTLINQAFLGDTLIDAGRLTEAEIVLRATNDMQGELYGNVGLDVAFSAASLARLLDQQGKLEEAIKLYDEAASMYEEVWGATAPQAAAVRLLAIEARQRLAWKLRPFQLWQWMRDKVWPGNGK
ncbi:hypothetical protein OHC33_003276 [Knufia fluminis]|uniref:Uncharacterized protein n=1 Tax=Knufia fluminis TaxID=191047 RepID=A0AAN8ETS5_9EURO|nr:hypothetical protein OHC33_003276 [Knufia fluminis]